jgi:hypothetical protein
MRPTGLTWIALTGLMVLGATTATAGVTCKVVPSWCPAGDGARDIGGGNGRNGVTASNKGHREVSTNGASAGTNDVAAGTAGVTAGTTGVGVSTAGVTAGTTGVTASTAGVAGGTTAVAANAPGTAASTGAVAGKPTSVPEPASLFLLGAGVSAVGAAMRRRRKGS